MSDATPAQWGVMAVPTGMSGRGDLAAQSLKAALAAGWEPFAVDAGYIWLRKKEAEATNAR